MNDRPDLAEVFRTLAEMKELGVVADYAVGGAVAAIFYSEPRETFDLDIFFLIGKEPSSPLARLEPIYEYGRSRGFTVESEFIQIGGWSVQFLEAFSPLWADAVKHARTLLFEGTPVRIIDPEFLAAMMVETGRGKDWIRLADFFESNVLDVERFESILQKYGLSETWDKQKWRLGGNARTN
jgi:hypothetical protein